MRLDLGIGGGLVGDGEEVIGVVSGCEMSSKQNDMFVCICFY